MKSVINELQSRIKTQPTERLAQYMSTLPHWAAKTEAGWMEFRRELGAELRAIVPQTARKARFSLLNFNVYIVQVFSSISLNGQTVRGSIGRFAKGDPVIIFRQRFKAGRLICAYELDTGEVFSIVSPFIANDTALCEHLKSEFSAVSHNFDHAHKISCTSFFQKLQESSLILFGNFQDNYATIPFNSLIGRAAFIPGKSTGYIIDMSFRSHNS